MNSEKKICEYEESEIFITIVTTIFVSNIYEKSTEHVLKNAFYHWLHNLFPDRFICNNSHNSLLDMP